MDIPEPEFKVYKIVYKTYENGKRHDKTEFVESNGYQRPGRNRNHYKLQNGNKQYNQEDVVTFETFYDATFGDLASFGQAIVQSQHKRDFVLENYYPL